MKNFIQRSFRRELLVSFLAVSVLPLIVCCVFLIQMFKVKVGRDFEKKDMELAGAVEQQLMTLFDAYHDAAEELSRFRSLFLTSSSSRCLWAAR